MTDLRVDNHGSIYVLTPNTDEAEDWIKNHIDPDAMGWGQKGIVVEHRFIRAIVEGAANDGLTIEE